MTAAGIRLKPLDELHYLFFSFPTKFDTVTTILENTSGVNMSMAKSSLIAEEIKLQSRQKAVVREDVSPASAFKARSQIKCYVCDEIGHKSYECPSSVGQVVDEVAMIARKRIANQPRNSNEKQVKWILDSGATNHMVNDISCLNSVQNFGKQREIQLAENGKSAYSWKNGTVNCYSDKKVKLVISDVLYVPQLRYNLLSLKKLTSLGLIVVFVGKKAIIKKSGKTVGTGFMENGLYEFVVSVDNVLASGRKVPEASGRKMRCVHEAFQK